MSLWDDLTFLYDVRCECQELERRLRALHSTALTGVRYDGVGGGSSGVSSPTENLALRTAALQRSMTNHLALLRKHQAWMMDVIGGIPDPQIRRILLFHFYDGYSWDRISEDPQIRRILLFHFYDGYSWDRISEDLPGHARGPSVRDRCRRYVAKYEQEHDLPEPPAGK